MTHDYKIRFTQKGNIRITLTPLDARIVHGMLGYSAGGPGSDLYDCLESAMHEGAFQEWTPGKNFDTTTAEQS
jgi:hypothetical protein